MKTLDEKIKQCKVCKNRDFDPMCGIVCALTKEKPAFEEECDKYIEDEAQVAKQADKERELAEENDISGWLAVFLWIGLLGGALLSIGTSLFNGSFNQGLFVAVIQVLYLIPLVLSAILAIIAFYKRWPNAVSLAKSYIIMIYMDAALSLLSLIILDNPSIVTWCIRNLVWATLWITYLHQSEKVKIVIPETVRVWKAPEKILLAIFTIVWLAVASLTVVGKLAQSNPQLLSSVNINQIDNTIKANNKNLPIDYKNGLVWSKMFKDDDSVVYLYNYKDIYKSDVDEKYTEQLALVQKHEVMADSATLLEDPFIGMCINAGYKVVFRYNDSVDQKLYDVVIDSEDYQKALNSEKYKCPISDIMRLINQYTADLPAEYPGGITLHNISLSSDNNTVVYNVRLPYMSADMYSTLTPAYLNNYFFENLSALLDDFIMRLAVVNQMTICFDISTASGVKYTKVNITPDKYNKIK
ncbi:MAG: hypothetical protein IKA04_01965 [Alistipes sp.]|nr:hypothetical protein [Alistipes sp.]